MGHGQRARLETALRIAEDSLQLAHEYRVMVAGLLASIDAGTAPAAELLAECRQALVTHADHDSLADARERAGVQAEAVARVEARTTAIQEAVLMEIRQDVARAYAALSAQLAEHFAALAPVNARLFALRRQHGGSRPVPNWRRPCGGTNWA